MMVFNSERGIMTMKGIPMMMKEVAEFFECGKLLDYRLIDFLRTLEKYSSI